MELILVRGVSGSGKSTLVDLLGQGADKWSTDDFFMVNGEYQFDPSKLGEYHRECQHGVEYSMNADIPKILVANTFTKEWEMEPYFALAMKYGYRVHTIIVENRHGSKSIHDVPPEVLAAQKERFEVVL